MVCIIIFNMDLKWKIINILIHHKYAFQRRFRAHSIYGWYFSILSRCVCVSVDSICNICRKCSFSSLRFDANASTQIKPIEREISWYYFFSAFRFFFAVARRESRFEAIRLIFFSSSFMLFHPHFTVNFFFFAFISFFFF